MRHVCFTVNNYTEADIGGLRHLSNMKGVGYMVFGKEVGESGTPHLQGYVEFNSSKKMSFLHKHIPRGHFEERRGTSQQAAEYCKKDGVFEEYGEISNQGARSDLNQLCFDIQSGQTLHNVMEQYPMMYMKYPKSIESLCSYYRAQNNIEQIALRLKHVDFKPWQSVLYFMLDELPDPRKVLWYWDYGGNTGKSFMATYLMVYHRAYVVTGGTKADIFYAYEYQRVVVFDLSRDCQDKSYIYDVIENFKNGQFLSTKYMTQMKVFPPPHVIVFANFPPDKVKLSQDRWVITDLNARG